MHRNTVVLLNTDEGRTLVQKKCQHIGLKMSGFEQLVEAELDQQGKQRKAGIWDSFDQILEEAFDSEEVL